MNKKKMYKQSEKHSKLERKGKEKNVIQNVTSPCDFTKKQIKGETFLLLLLRIKR